MLSKLAYIVLASYVVLSNVIKIPQLNKKLKQ